MMDSTFRFATRRTSLLAIGLKKSRNYRELMTFGLAEEKLFSTVLIFSGEPFEPARLSPSPEELKVYEERVQRGEIRRSGSIEIWKKTPKSKVYDESVVLGENKGLANVLGDMAVSPIASFQLSESLYR